MTSLERLIQLIEEVTGVVVPDHDRTFVERLALEQAQQGGHGELEPYLHSLRANLESAEWQSLLSRITVKESYLFRGPQQLRALADDVLPRLAANRPEGSPLRVWSAGCARGEEPTTLAMVLAESRHLVGRDWRILATDVDESALRDARRAVFGRRAVARVPPPLLERHMVARGGGSYALVDRLRGHIEYRVLNLVTQPLSLPEAPFDLVFLRNVLIYFRPEQQRRVVEAVVEGLAPKGWLFLGPAESLWQLDTGLEPVDMGDCFCYRLPTATNDQGEPVTDPVAGELGRPVPEEDLQEVVEVPSASAAAPLGHDEPLTSSGPDLEPILQALGRGQMDSAEALIRGAIRVSPDDARLRAFQGLMAELAGDQRTAVRCYRAALYLEPRLFQVRYLLGRCLERTGWREQAHRAFREALTMAERGKPAVEIPGAELVGIPSASQVAVACRRAMEC